MKKFHKRAAVFLTAATLAGLPAGAFFYSSPGSLTVWADNVEVESSEESSPEDVDFSDESEAEILADPVEQAQEDAGNDVTETPEVRDYLYRTRRLADRYGNRKNSSGRYKEYRCFFYCKSRSKTFRKWRMVRHNRKYGSIHLF